MEYRDNEWHAKNIEKKLRITYNQRAQPRHFSLHRNYDQLRIASRLGEERPRLLNLLTCKLA